MRCRLLPLVLLLTACGSTVATTGSQQLQGQGGAPAAGAGAGLGVPAAPSGSITNGAMTSAAGAPGAAGGRGGQTVAVPAGGGRPASSGTTSGPGRTSSGAGTQNGTRAGSPAAAGAPRGVTASAISIGLPYTTNGAAATAAYGATGAGAGGGDGKAIWQAYVDAINASGGVAGRKLAPVYHAIDATSQEPEATIEQNECTDWTQDHHVFWVAAADGKTLVPCLAKAGVGQSYAQPTDAATAFYKQFPSYIEAGTLQMDRIAAALPGALAQQGWFGNWDTAQGAAGGAAPVRVGVVAFDDDYTKNAVRSLLVPGLKQHSAAEPEVVFIATPQGAADNGTAIAAIQNATLRFRQDGVTHVIAFETQGAGVGVFFSQGAEQQKWYPRYGITSGNAVQLYVDQNLWPKTQLRGMLGMGWEPLLDLTQADDPDSGPYSNATRRDCVAIAKRANIDVSSAIVERQALEYCVNLRFLKATLEAGGQGPTLAGFEGGAARLGHSFPSPLTFGTFFDANHHDGVSLWRPLAELPSCTCIRYAGDPTPVA